MSEKCADLHPSQTEEWRKKGMAHFLLNCCSLAAHYDFAVGVGSVGGLRAIGARMRKKAHYVDMHVGMIRRNGGDHMISMPRLL